MRWAIAITVLSTAVAHADPSAVRGAVTPERAQPCAQPGCDAASAKDDDQAKPVDVRIALGEIAVASMEGVWLRRGPTLRNKPILVSPIVVGNALTLSLGGSF
jgi:hypothetical protein